MFSKIAALTFVHNINKGWDIACMTLRFATIFQDLLREHFLVPRCTVQTVQKQMLKKKTKKKTQNGLQIYRRGSQFNSRGLTTTK